MHDVSFPERWSDQCLFEHMYRSRDELTKSAFYIVNVAFLPDFPVLHLFQPTTNRR